LRYYYTNVENGLTLRRYWTTACQTCAIKSRCTPAKERRITRWEHEHVLEAVQRRLDENPEAMRQRRETVEHPFGTIKARMGATHFLMKTLPRVSGEMALHVLAYNLTRVMNIIGIKPLMAASDACDAPGVLAADPQRRSGWPARGPVTCIQIAKNARNALVTAQSRARPVEKPFHCVFARQDPERTFAALSKEARIR